MINRCGIQKGIQSNHSVTAKYPFFSIAVARSIQSIQKCENTTYIDIHTTALECMVLMKFLMMGLSKIFGYFGYFGYFFKKKRRPIHTHIKYICEIFWIPTGYLCPFLDTRTKNGKYNKEVNKT